MRCSANYTGFLFLIALFSCSSGTRKKDVAVGNASTVPDSGTVQFWQADSSRYAITRVTINNRIEMITLDIKKDPGCGTVGCALFRLPEGLYTYYAFEASPGSNHWRDTIHVVKNCCRNIQLQ